MEGEGDEGLGGSVVKNLPAMQETWVLSLGLEDPLEKGMATDSSILIWRIPWTEEPGRLWPMRSQRVGHHQTRDKGVLVYVGTFWPSGDSGEGQMRFLLS